MKNLKRSLPEGNHAVSYCCEAASQIRPEELPAEITFEAPVADSCEEVSQVKRDAFETIS